MRALLLRVLIPLLLFTFVAPTNVEAAGSKSAVAKKGTKKKRAHRGRRKHTKRLSRRARRRIARAKAKAARAKAKAARAKAKTTRAKAKTTGAKAKTTGADAAKKARIAQAKRAFLAGRAAFSQKNWSEAVARYKEAYGITKDGLVMGQVALACEKAGDYERALKSIRVYRSALPQSDRRSVDGLVTKYEKLIADGKSKHLLLPGETPPAVAALPPLKVAKDPAPNNPYKVPTDEPQVKKRGRFWTWIVLGGAGALAVSALVVGLSAQSKFDELKDSCGSNCSDDDVSSVRTRAVATDILWGTALAAGITAGVLFFVEGRGGGTEKRDELKDIEEESDELVKSFKITPLVGAGTYGLGADIRF